MTNSLIGCTSHQIRLVYPSAGSNCPFLDVQNMRTWKNTSTALIIIIIAGGQGHDQVGVHARRDARSRQRARHHLRLHEEPGGQGGATQGVPHHQGAGTIQVETTMNVVVQRLQA
jgi:hypothetical protein